jgi:hypothetical protein
VLFDGAQALHDPEGGSSKAAALQGTFSLFPFAGNEMAMINDYCGPDRSEAAKDLAEPGLNCKYQVTPSRVPLNRAVVRSPVES